MTGNARRILVAGATGYLGGFVARELKSRGHFVRALARTPGKLAADLALDDVVHGEITRPDDLATVCDGVDVVFSSVGITRQQGELTFRDVDYQGNKNLLDAALRAGVRKFVYVSVLDGPELLQLEIVKAHEDLVAALQTSGIDYTVIRPTGYFSDMGDMFRMAVKGRVYLFGDGQCRVNPIHGADLATVCAHAVENGAQAIDVGGPEIFTWCEIAELAFATLQKPVKISRVPVWLARAAVSATRLINRHNGELLAFFTTMATRDVVAPAVGNHRLSDYFEQLLGGA